MQNTDKVVIVCSKIGQTAVSTQGIEAFCGGCNHKVWLSDSSINAVKAKLGVTNLDDSPPALMCMDCAVVAAKKGEMEVADITPEQIKEIKDSLK